MVNNYDLLTLLYSEFELRPGFKSESHLMVNNGSVSEFMRNVWCLISRTIESINYTQFIVIANINYHQ